MALHALEIFKLNSKNGILNACQSKENLRQPRKKNGMSEWLNSKYSDLASTVLLASCTIIVNLRSFRIPLFTSYLRIYYSLWFSRFMRTILSNSRPNKNECQFSVGAFFPARHNWLSRAKPTTSVCSIIIYSIEIFWLYYFHFYRMHRHNFSNVLIAAAVFSLPLAEHFWQPQWFITKRDCLTAKQLWCAFTES